MHNSIKRSPKNQKSWLFFFTVVLLIGIFFRFYNIDKKAYWIDEAYTSLWISGYTEADMRSHFTREGIISNRELQKYRQVNPEKNVGDTVRSLALEDPQHPPIYYILTRYWVQLWGNSVGAIRSLPALLSLLLFPSAYWLCLELFGSSSVGWVAMALMAVSPFHIMYAQEARQYSLWTAIALLTSATLLWAMRVKRKTSWIIYAIAITIGLYSAIFTGILVISHGIYVIVTERFRLSQTVKSYLAASLGGFLIFTPWILVIFNNLQRIKDTTSWSNETITPLTLAFRWVGNLGRVFLDLGFDASDSFSKTASIIPFLLGILFLVGYGIYFLYTNAPRQTWVFLFILIGSTFLVFLIPDLILGGRRSGTARYLIPCYLGIQIVIAYLLANRMTYLPKKIWKQKLWQVITVVLLSAGIVSCFLSSQTENWWSKGTAQFPGIPEMARLVNQTEQPLFCIENKILSVLRAFSYRLDPDVAMQLVFTPETLKTPEEFSNIFFYRPSDANRDRLEKNNRYILKSTQELGKFQSDMLWVEKI